LTQKEIQGNKIHFQASRDGKGTVLREGKYYN
jgi:hypothetical protein